MNTENKQQLTREAVFLKEFEAWIRTQIAIHEMAMEESRKVLETDRDERAADAYIRYESRLDAYRFMESKFVNYHEGKDFHDLPDSFFGKRHY